MDSQEEMIDTTRPTGPRPAWRMMVEATPRRMMAWLEGGAGAAAADLI